jgi:hypothetical protein
MAALMGARGGVHIPDEDRKPVYNHLAKHYEQFDREPPSFEKLEELREKANALEERGLLYEALKVTEEMFRLIGLDFSAPKPKIRFVINTTNGVD